MECIYEMLSLGVLLFNLFPGPQHLIHGVYYLLRAWFTTDKDRNVGFPEMGRVPERYTDILCVPLMTLMLTVPEPSCGDFAFVPYFVTHVMGYGSPVWFSVLPGAFFTMYTFLRPQVLYLLVGALASRYVRGDNMRLGLVFAAGCHLIMAAFEPLQFSFLSVCVVLFMAECKLRLQWQYELIPPVYPSVNMFAVPVYVMNAFVWDWAHTWKYTDKVWRSFDIFYPLANIVVSYFIRRVYSVGET
jgi:hypothetical protein